MRPERFETLLKSLLEEAGAAVQAVETVRDAGYTRHPYGLIVTYRTGARVLLQIVQTSPRVEDFTQPEQIIEGDTAPEHVTVPDVFNQGKVSMQLVDQHLRAVVLNSGSREIADGEAFSTRKTPGAVRYGAKFTFHDESTIYVYVVNAFEAGCEMRTGAEFKVEAAV